MERRTIRFADFLAVGRDADALLAAGYDRAGNWSLGQVATHLAKVVEMSLDGFPWYLPWPVTAVCRWVALGKILRHEVIRKTLKAPKFLDPGPPGDDAAGVERLRAALTRLQAHAGPLRPSPLFGRLTPEQWREVHLWHCEHHLSFLIGRRNDER